MISGGHCTFGFKHHGKGKQDLPSGQKISSQGQIEFHECANLCKQEPSCCSFQYSRERKRCILNKECEPTEPKKLDFSFCEKMEGIGNMELY